MVQTPCRSGERGEGRVKANRVVHVDKAVVNLREQSFAKAAVNRSFEKLWFLKPSSNIEESCFWQMI